MVLRTCAPCAWTLRTGDFNHIGVRIDYNRMDDDLEEELDAAEYEDFYDAEEKSEEEE